MVDGARPRLRAMADIDSPRASPNKISSRSSALRRPGAGVQRSGKPDSGGWTYTIAVTSGNEQLSSLAIAFNVRPLDLRRRAICFCSRVT
jgi:hypothetical protein